MAAVARAAQAQVQVDQQAAWPELTIEKGLARNVDGKGYGKLLSSRLSRIGAQVAQE